MKMQDYNINVLIEATNDYFYAEEELKRFLKTWVPGWWEDKTAKERENYTKYTERSNEKGRALSMLCKLVDIDMDTLISMCKAINRWERHGGKWDRETCIHVTYRTENNVKRALSNPDPYDWAGHYRSTGRKIAC